MTPAIRSIRLLNGVHLQFAEQGDRAGTPVVLLHGITDSWRSFESVMAHLPTRLHVLAPSQRGHGASDRPGRYRTRDFAGDAAAFIEALGLGPALVVGHSMGSVNAMRLAIDRPELVRGLVLAGAFASFSGNAELVEFNRTAMAPLQDPIDPGFAAEWQQSTLAHPVPPAFFDMVVRECLQAPAGVWRDAFAALFEDDFTAEMQRIGVPTLIVWGERDVMAPVGDQERIARTIEGSRRITYQGAGHALHWEQPERFARDVAGFAEAVIAGDFTRPPSSARAAAVDARGCPVGTASTRAIEHAEKGLWRLVSYYGNALDDLDAAIAEDPNWPLPHVMKANALLSMTEHGLGLEAIESLQRAAELAAAGCGNERERRHIAASRLCAAGQWQPACDAWEAILVDHPQDLVALQIAHLFDFYRGDARNLHRRVARVLPEWSPRAPLYSFVLGMQAFGLEEANLYPQALDAGHAALAMDARDPWAVHAVTHVHEMRGDFDRGAHWLESRQQDWSPDNGFAFHNWWHLALFHLERCDTAAALALLDERVMPGAEFTLQRIDIGALLWRLHLMDIDVGERWSASAAGWPGAPEAGHYAFNDLHAVLALVGAGRLDDAVQVVEATRAKSREQTTTGAMAADVGVPLMLGILAHGRGRYAEAIEALGSARDGCHRFGGSHAQRDLVDQTLIDAAIRGGRPRLAKHLLNERMPAKAHSPLTQHWAARIG